MAKTKENKKTLEEIITEHPMLEMTKEEWDDHLERFEGNLERAKYVSRAWAFWENELKEESEDETEQ